MPKQKLRRGFVTEAHWWASSLREEMKIAALLAKCYADPEAGKAVDIFRMATKDGAEAFGIDAGMY